MTAMSDTLTAKITKKRSVGPETSVSARCSCSSCGSLCCFLERNRQLICICDDCDKSQTCLSTGKNLKNSHSDQIFAVYVESAKSAAANTKIEVLNDCTVNYEADRQRLININQPPPSSLDEYRSRLLQSIPKPIHKPKSLSEYIELISGNQYKNKQELLNSYIKNLKISKPNGIKIDDERRMNVETVTTPRKCKTCCKKYHKSVKEFDNAHEVPITTTFNVEVLNKRKNLNNSDCCLPSKFSTLPTNIFFNDNTFKRLTDIYKPSNCEVNMSRKIMKKEVCKCKPCECIECIGYMTKGNIPGPDKKFPELKFAYSSLSKTRRKDYSYDCAQYQNNNVAISCNCEPCQCIECKKTSLWCDKKTLAFALTAEDQKNTTSYCSHSECIKYNNIFNDSLIEVPTETDNHAPCYCEICSSNAYENDYYKFSRSDIDKNQLVEKDNHHVVTKTKKSKKQNILTMYAALPHTYRARSVTKNIKSCSCQECERMICVNKEDTINSIKSSRLFSCDKKGVSNDASLYLIKQSFSNNLEHKSCENLVCTLSKLKNESSTINNRIDHLNNCTIDEHHYSGLCSVDTKINSRRCKCSTCRCERCFGDDFIPFTRSCIDHQTNIFRNDDVSNPLAQKLILAKGNLPKNCRRDKTGLLCTDINYNTKPKCISRDQIAKLRDSMNVRSGPSTLKVINTVAEVNKSKKDSGLELSESLGNNIMKYDTYEQCREWAKNSFREKSSGNYISMYSSTETMSKTTFCKRNYYNMPILGKNKSWVSCCNSSGRDKQFPESECCSEKVLKMDLEHDFVLNTKPISSNQTSLTSDSGKFLQISQKKATKTVESVSTSEGSSVNENMLQNKGALIEGRYSYSYAKENIPVSKKKHTIKSSILNKKMNNMYQSLKLINNESSQSLNIKGSEVFDINLNETYLTRHAYTYYNFIDTNVTRFMQNKESCTSFNIDSSEVDKDYKSVYKTLKEAKEFSIHLLNLLEVYEKANKDFVPVYSKMKDSPTFIDREHVERELTCKVKSESSAVLNQKQQKGSVTSITVQNQQSSNARSIEKINSFQQNNNRNAHKPELKYERILHDKNEYINQQYNKKHDINIFGNVRRYLEDEEIKVTLNNEYHKNKKIMQKRNCHKCSKDMQPTLSVSKKIWLKTRNPDTHKTESKTPFKDGRYIQTVKQLHCANKKISRDTTTAEQVSPLVNIPTQLDFKLPQKVNKKTGSLPLYYLSKEVLCSDHLLSGNMEKGMKELIKKFIMKPEIREKIKAENFNYDTLLSARNQDSQRVKFILCRKVSDHTVLVKWTRPEKCSDVLGYELLVNGRPVHKVFNPASFLAVVTCLPHANEILLTIRTIITSVLDSRHYPATTIVYRPRALN